MPEDLLFSRSEARRIKKPLSLIPNCGRCGLFRNGCATPKMPVWGRGAKRVLFVSDCPGKAEDAAGHAFAGGAGRHLAETLARQGFDLERDGWSTNSLICHDVGRAEPKTAVEDCRPNLLRTIDTLKPTAIVLLGGYAVSSLIGHVWKADVGPMARWTGRVIPCQKPNAWLCPTNNPAFVLRDTTDPVSKLQFSEQLAVALERARNGPPWPDGPPDYKALVETIASPQEAAARLRNYRDGVIAFDYESTCLKPDGPHAELVCCSVCWNGTETIAFPWLGPVIPEMRRILGDPNIGKIASNLDMEARWSLAKLGVTVQNWVWDTMLAAHCLDPRPGGRESEDGESFGSGTTGLKYQAFVRLGMEEYNSHLEDHLRSQGQGGNAPNRVRALTFQALGVYCALDSLLEYLVAESQAEEMGTTLWDR